MRNEKLVTLAEVALAIALAFVLEFLKVKLPDNLQGGSVCIEMLPLIILAFRRGWLPGLIAGFIYGSIDPLTGGEVIHWASFFLDYSLPFALVGLGAGLGKNAVTKALDCDKLGKAIGFITAFTLVGVVLRYISHVISGAVLWAEYAPVGQSAWIYSLVYNAPYLIISTILCLVLAYVFIPALHKAVPVRKQA